MKCDFTVLDTAAGVWLDRHGLVTAPRTNKTEDPSLELMRRCRHAAASVGVRLYIYGGLRGGKAISVNNLRHIYFFLLLQIVSVFCFLCPQFY